MKGQRTAGFIQKRALQLSAINDGLSGEGDRDAEAKAVATLDEIGFTEKGKTKRKPGKKPSDTTNPTEEKIRTKFRILRGILGESFESGNITNVQVLATIIGVIEVHSAHSKVGLYLLPDDVEALLRLQQCESLIERMLDCYLRLPEQRIGSNVPSLVDFKDALNFFLEELRFGYNSHSLRAFTETSFSQVSGQKLKASDTDPLYIELKKTLRLSNSVSRLTVLDATCKFLQELRTMLSDCRYLERSDSIDRLYEIAHASSLAYGMVPAEFELEGIFLRSISRQRVSPFLPIANEEIVPD